MSKRKIGRQFCTETITMGSFMPPLWFMHCPNTRPHQAARIRRERRLQAMAVGVATTALHLLGHRPRVVHFKPFATNPHRNTLCTTCFDRCAGSYRVWCRPVARAVGCEPGWARRQRWYRSWYGAWAALWAVSSQAAHEIGVSRGTIIRVPAHARFGFVLGLRSPKIVDS